MRKSQKKTSRKKTGFGKFIRMVMISANIFVALCLLLTYLCCFVSPKFVWWIGFFGLAYIYLFAANLCFAAGWLIFGKKKLALISLIVVGIGWNMIGKNIQLFEKKLPDAKAETALKVISFNVHMFSQRDAVQPDGTQLNMFDYLRESAVDIICMQEFMSTKWVDDLTETVIRKQFDQMPYYYLEQTIGAVGIATFSKYPIVRKQLIYSDNTTNACIFCDVIIDSDTVRVYNIHLKSVGFTMEERALLDNVVKKEYNNEDVGMMKAMIRQMAAASVRRARQVNMVSEHISASPYPVIICGDFNDPPASYSYRKIRGDKKDAFVESGKGRSTTYNIGDVSSQRIDYIMHSSDFMSYDYESPRVRLSDHFPVMCRLVKANK